MRVALVSARGARDLDEDLPPLVAAFAAAGAQAQVTVWDDPQVAWSGFDAALLRSAWDYTERIGEFLEWVGRTAAVTRLLNPPPVVRWNSDKHYLQDLARLGVPIVASEFVEPGMDPQAALAHFLASHDSPELVVKPAVGAGSRDARRHARAAQAQILGHMAPLLAAGRSLLMQPYLSSVDRSGETSLVYIEGAFSHAFRKGPLLPLGAGPTDALFAAEEITARVPGADELAVGSADPGRHTVQGAALCADRPDPWHPPRAAGAGTGADRAVAVFPAWRRFGREACAGHPGKARRALALHNPAATPEYVM